jgi:hypothetical protein
MALFICSRTEHAPNRHLTGAATLYLRQNSSSNLQRNTKWEAIQAALENVYDLAALEPEKNIWLKRFRALPAPKASPEPQAFYSHLNTIRKRGTTLT